MADEESRQRGPYTVAYPVDFTPQGDTTQVAFRKHIDEIIRIYGILTGLDAATLDADDVHEILNEHINSTNPHPNYRPSISWNDLTNKPGLDSLSGTLNASKVYGNLSNATIDYNKVNDLPTYLSGYLSGRIPADKGDGITAGSLNENGYVKFNNGLIIQWGRGADQSSYDSSTNATWVSFPVSFSSKCLNIVANGHKHSATRYGLRTQVEIVQKTTTGFSYIHDTDFGTTPTGGGVNTSWYLEYMAIGV